MAILAMPLHGRDAHGTFLRRAMAVSAMPEHGRDARHLAPTARPTQVHIVIGGWGQGDERILRPRLPATCTIFLTL